MRNQPIMAILARKNNIISGYIQSSTWSKWSHVVIVDGDHVIQSVGIPPVKLFLVLFGIIPNSARLGGVKRTPLDEFLTQYPETRTIWFDGDINIARNMVDNTMYDAWGVLGVKFKYRIDCDDKMTCSKMVWLCHSGLRDEFAYRATPQSILENSRDYE